MKRVLFSILLILVASLLFGCAEKSDIENLQEQIDEIKTSQIASIQQQMVAVNASVLNLQSVDTELRSYITNLQEQYSILHTIDEELGSSLQKINEDLIDSIAVSKSSILAQIENYKLLIDNQLLQIGESISALQLSDESIQNQITELKTYVDKELNDAKDWASATFVTLDQYNMTASIVASLQSQISIINEQIANLDIPENIVSKEEMDNAIASLDETLKEKINKVINDCSNSITSVKAELVAAYTKAIQDAISSSESSIKTWVNSQLTGYYTISQSDAQLASLRTSLEGQLNNQKTQLQNLLTSLESALTLKIEENASDIEECQSLIATCKELIQSNAKAIKDNSDSIDQLRADLTNTKEEITTAYKNAITTAINNLDGKLTGIIAEEVETINTRITEKITEVNGEITDLKTRMAACEKDIKSIKTSIYNMESEIEDLQEKVADILARIQSVAFVPDYSDGRAVMYYTKNSNITPGTAQLTYEFVPAGTAGDIAKVWQSALSMKAVYTVTKAPEVVNLTIESASADDGYLTIIVSGAGLSDAFFLYQRSVNVSLKISDGNNELATDYVQLVPWTTDTITFGDANFKTYCLENFDSNTDGEISIEEAASVTSIDASSLGITSFIGIEYFSSLKNLDVSYNKATNLDLSHSPLITEVIVKNNQLTTLNLAGCSNIVTLDCSNNDLTELECGDAKAIQELACANNKLGQLNLKNNKALVRLQCSGNNLAVLDLSNNTAITSLFCRKNSLSTLDLIKNTALTELDCSYNDLSSLDVSNNLLLESLLCSSNSITSLNVVNNTELSYLNCSKNVLKSLDVTKNPKLKSLDCSNNQIASLDISRNYSLETVTCNNNDGLTKLWVKDAAQQASLTIIKDDGTMISFNDGGIYIPDTKLKAYLLPLFDDDEDGEISIIEAENIQNVNCSRRNIADLTGLQDCPNLKYLNISENSVSAINLPNLSKLETVVAYGNPIETLIFNNDKDFKALYLQDVNTNVLKEQSITINNYSQATSLYISFVGTNYTELDISNNTGLTHYDISENIQLKKLVAYNCPNVTSVSLASLSELNYLDVCSCSLSALNLDTNTKLVSLKCSGNNLTTINIDKNVDLVEINCSNNQIGTLRVTQNTLLESIDASNNQLQNINVRQNAKLKEINVSGNTGITALALGYNTALESLDASSTGLTDIDVTSNNLLTNLNLSGCGQIQVLDLKNNTQLTTLNLASTSIISLDVTSCKSLNSLDITGVESINSINVDSCPISSLKISGTQDSLLGQCVIPNGEKSIIFYATQSVVKIVSADHGSGRTWNVNNNKTNANSSSDGSYNMNIIKSLGISNYPAFEWCAAKGDEWYLPASSELEYLLNNFIIINKALKSIGGEQLKYGSSYWTSTESSISGAVDMYCNSLTNKVYIIEDYNKTNNGIIRAIRSL